MIAPAQVIGKEVLKPGLGIQNPGKLVENAIMAIAILMTVAVMLRFQCAVAVMASAQVPRIFVSEAKRGRGGAVFQRLHHGVLFHGRRAWAFGAFRATTVMAVNGPMKEPRAK